MSRGWKSKMGEIFNAITKYLSPLWTFIVGMVMSLLITIFFPSIKTAQDGLAANAAVQTGAYWGLQEVVTSTRLVIFVVCFFITLLLTATVWLKRRD